MEYTPIIGMEIHLQLSTQSKMFCSCSNNDFEQAPNTHICPICVGHPGTLPIVNKKALENTVKAALALQCEINAFTKFDRKNYFYPDLPKGYQISQYDRPIGAHGSIELLLDGETKKIAIRRIHLEEDTAKSFHAGNDTLIDFNRSGSPLVELVTEPDFRSGKEAREFCQELQQVFRYLEISDADMEKGHMRCEVNISLGTISSKGLVFGTKVEIKNLNSFKTVEKAVDFEIQRQSAMLDAGEDIVHETRGWDEDTEETVSQRVKETAADYRYFWEPDIPPVSFSDSEKIEHEMPHVNIKHIQMHMPELPNQKKKRFVNEFDLDLELIDVVLQNKQIAEFAESVLSELERSIKDTHDDTYWNKNKAPLSNMALSWMTSKLFSYMNEDNLTHLPNTITAENFAELIVMLNNKDINSSAGQKILKHMYDNGSDPSAVMDELGLRQIDDNDALQQFIDQIITAHPEQVAEYKSGKENVVQFLLGKVMAASKGTANPQKTLELLIKSLK